MPRLSCVAGRSSLRFALHLLHGGLEHRRVELESDGLNVAALLAAEHVARAAQLQIERRDFESRAQVAELFERGQTAARNLGQLVLRRNEQVRIGAAIGAAHAPAQLVELAEAVALGAVDEDGIGERDVETVLDDRGGDEHIELVAHEGEHDFFQVVLAHLAVRHGDTRRGHKLLNARGDFVDGFDAIVHEEHLAAALQLHLDGRADRSFRRTSPPRFESPCGLWAAFQSRSCRAGPPATCAACAEWAWRSWPARRSPCATASAAPCGARRSAALRRRRAGRDPET